MNRVMCKLCDSGQPQNHAASRRNFLKLASAVSAAAVAPFSLTAQPRTDKPASAAPPRNAGQPSQRYVIRGGATLSMDAKVGDFAKADVLVEGKKIIAIKPSIEAGNATVIDATGMIGMPGFIDTHHHQFETTLRSFLPNGLLANDGQPHGAVNYMDYVLGRFTAVYKPEDVYIAELLGSLSQLDAGVTTVHDISQIYHTPAHTEAALKAINHTGQRTVMSYSESQGNTARFPDDVRRLQQQSFSSKDQLSTLIIGGEIYAPGAESAWQLARNLNLPIASHIVGPAVVNLVTIAKAGKLGKDNLLIHVTGVDDDTWKRVADSGAGISLSVPIEMAMRHGTPPILKALSMGKEPSLSSDVECTMTADFFTQMRSVFTLQRMLVNEMVLQNKANVPALLTARDVIRFATQRGAKHLWLDDKIGSLTPGKEADIILLNTAAINMAPLNNVPGAVVNLMDRSNVDTVIVAGKIRKWKGALLDFDIAKLTSEITASRDRLFAAAKIPVNLFGD